MRSIDGFDASDAVWNLLKKSGVRDTDRWDEHRASFTAGQPATFEFHRPGARGAPRPGDKVNILTGGGAGKTIEVTSDDIERGYAVPSSYIGSGGVERHTIVPLEPYAYRRGSPASASWYLFPSQARAVMWQRFAMCTNALLSQSEAMERLQGLISRTDDSVLVERIERFRKNPWAPILALIATGLDECVANIVLAANWPETTRRWHAHGKWGAIDDARAFLASVN